MTIALGKFTKDENDLFDIMDDWLRRDRFVFVQFNLMIMNGVGFSLNIYWMEKESHESCRVFFYLWWKKRSPACMLRLWLGWRNFGNYVLEKGKEKQKNFHRPWIVLFWKVAAICTLGRKFWKLLFATLFFIFPIPLAYFFPKNDY